MIAPAERPLDCAAMRRHLPLFVGGDLPESVLAAARAHLIDCADCRRSAGGELAALRALRRQAVATQPALPVDFFAALHRDVLASVAAHSSPGAASGAWHRLRGFVRIAAAALLSFAGGVYLAGGGGAGGLAGRPAIRSSEHAGDPGRSGGRPLLRPMQHQFTTDIAGFDTAGIDGAVPGTGLMGRLQLRLLVDEAADDGRLRGGSEPVPVHRRPADGR